MNFHGQRKGKVASGVLSEADIQNSRSSGHRDAGWEVGHLR